MSTNVSLKNYLADLEGPNNGIYNFYDWFCKDHSLPAKKEKLDKLVQKIAASKKIDQEKVYVFYKNNCPLYGNLYDDFRICDLETGDVIFTVTPRSGHKNVEPGKKAEIWGSENNFEGPLVQGTWKDVLAFFEV